MVMALKWRRLLLVAVFALIDQAHKLTQIYGFGWRGGEQVTITPFFDYVLVWNRGISYGLFSFLPAWVIIIIMCVLTLFVIIWMLRVPQGLLVWSLALIGGGALGNLVDRIVHGAVADFFFFHAFGFHWYIFNLADVAITLGILIWIWDIFFGHKTTKSESDMVT